MENNTHKRKATSEKAANQNNTPSYSNSTEDQRKRLMDWLITNGSIDTVTARRVLDIMMPGARVHELRHKFGHCIHTVRIKQPTECGKLHRVALYVLNGVVQS